MDEKPLEPHDSHPPNLLFDDDGPLSDPLEQHAIFAALDSFHQYRKNAHYNVTHRRRQNLYALPEAQWKMLAAPPISLLDTLAAVDDAIDVNADFADEIVLLGLSSFGLSETSPHRPELDWRGKAQPTDMSKAHSTVRQFYRDWSHEGYTAEIEPLLKATLSDLEAAFPNALVTTASRPPSLLLPGAGLGRVLFELCLRGYNATGNEISYHQLLASNFVLNSTQRADEYSIYPFASTFTNVTSRRHQLKCHTIPDVHPGLAFAARLEDNLPVGEMNMTAGDFVLSYAGPDTRGVFDGVVSIFFIDTAPNLIRYIEAVRNCLRPGGVWINIGPLLWHFDGQGYGQGYSQAQQERSDTSQSSSHGGSMARGNSSEPSHRTQGARENLEEDRGIGEPGAFELSDEEVVQLVTSMGFEIIKHEVLSASASTHQSGFGYMQDPTSLLQSRYQCSHWVARKL